MRIRLREVRRIAKVEFKNFGTVAGRQYNVSNSLLFIRVQRVTQHHHVKRLALARIFDSPKVARLGHTVPGFFQDQPSGLHCGIVNSYAQHVCRSVSHRAHSMSNSALNDCSRRKQVRKRCGDRCYSAFHVARPRRLCHCCDDLGDSRPPYRKTPCRVSLATRPCHAVCVAVFPQEIGKRGT